MITARLMLVLLLPIVGGCASHAPAPVEERGSAPAAAKPAMHAAQVGPTAPEVGVKYHTVKKGDTLYGIALDNGHDYKDIAAWNNLDNPNLISGCRETGKSWRASRGKHGLCAACCGKQREYRYFQA